MLAGFRRTGILTGSGMKLNRILAHFLLTVMAISLPFAGVRSDEPKNHDFVVFRTEDAVPSYHFPTLLLTV